MWAFAPKRKPFSAAKSSRDLEQDQVCARHFSIRATKRYLGFERTIAIAWRCVSPLHKVPAISLERPAITTVGNYSTLLNTVETASELSIMCISVPCLTSTKKRFSGTGLLGVFTVAIPVQSGLTV
jgi:hypothetical protein